MPATISLACPRCGRERTGGELVCGLCGELLGRAPRAAAPPEIGPEAAESKPRDASAARAPWLYLGVGLVAAPLFALPLLSFMAWFLAALVHEMGHTAVAWLCGTPALPAISPGGHGATLLGERSLVVLGLVLAGVGWALSRVLEGRRRWLVLATLVLVQGVLVATELGELAHLVAGHGAELAFAALCLWKALDGGFTSSRLERGLHATLGWVLLGRNLWLCLGLVRSAAERGAYRSNGSFGLTNDYLRVAERCGVRLEVVALGMGVVGLGVLPAAFGLWRLSRRSR